MSRLKSWQAFLYVIVALFLINFTIVGNNFATAVLHVIGMLMYFSWYVLIGHELYHLVPSKIGYSYNLFVVNYCLLVTLFGILVFLFVDGGQIHLTGAPALSGFYLLFALIDLMLFPARVLRTLELRRTVPKRECIGEFIMMLFLPIGIWFLQPRINKVYSEDIDR